MQSRLYCLIAATLLALASCSPGSDWGKGMNERKPSVGDKIGSVLGTDAGKAEAAKLWTPFLFAGSLGLIGGIAAVWFTGSWKLLMAGIAVAAAPAVISLILIPLLPYVAVASLLASLLLLVRLGWYVWDSVKDGVRENRREDEEWNRSHSSPS